MTRAASGVEIAADQIQMCCRIEQQGADVVRRQHAFFDKFPHQSLEDEAIDLAVCKRCRFSNHRRLPNRRGPSFTCRAKS